MQIRLDSKVASQNNISKGQPLIKTQKIAQNRTGSIKSSHTAKACASSVHLIFLVQYKTHKAKSPLGPRLRPSFNRLASLFILAGKKDILIPARALAHAGRFRTKLHILFGVLVPSFGCVTLVNWEANDTLEDARFIDVAAILIGEGLAGFRIGERSPDKCLLICAVVQTLTDHLQVIGRCSNFLDFQYFYIIKSRYFEKFRLIFSIYLCRVCLFMTRRVHDVICCWHYVLSLYG